MTSPVKTSADSCVLPIRERKRLASRCADDLPLKRSKVARRLADDSETSSPVSGMFIKVRLLIIINCNILIKNKMIPKCLDEEKRQSIK